MREKLIGRLRKLSEALGGNGDIVLCQATDGPNGIESMFPIQGTGVFVLCEEHGEITHAGVVRCRPRNEAITPLRPPFVPEYAGFIPARDLSAAEGYVNRLPEQQRLPVIRPLDPESE